VDGDAAILRPVCLIGSIEGPFRVPRQGTHHSRPV